MNVENATCNCVGPMHRIERAVELISRKRRGVIGFMILLDAAGCNAWDLADDNNL